MLLRAESTAEGAYREKIPRSRADWLIECKGDETIRANANNSWLEGITDYVAEWIATSHNSARNGREIDADNEALRDGNMTVVAVHCDKCK